VIKLDLVNEVANKVGLTKTKAEMAVETVFESMKRSLERGDKIELRGFGTFNVHPRKTPRTRAKHTSDPVVPGARLPYRSNLDQKRLRKAILSVAEESRA
jgi:nucleoid DNA-binding protein